MIPQDAWSELFKFTGALAALAGIFRWPRQGSAAEDELVAEAADVVLSAVSDADATRTVGCRTGRNWRDDVTLEEAVALGEERELRRWPGRN